MTSSGADPLAVMVTSLRADGLHEDAAALEALLETAWTSGSELAGEVGVVLRTIRKHNGARWSAATLRAHAEVAAWVKQAWPGWRA